MGLEEILPIIGLAASAAGTGTSIAASQAEKANMDRAVRQQLEQQKQYQKRGTQLFQTSKEQSTPVRAQEQIGQGAEAAQRLYAQLQATPISQATSQAVTPSNQAVDTQKQNVYAQQIGAPNAAMQGITNYNLQQWIKNLQAQTGLGVNSLLSGNAASVLPYKIQDASTSMAGLQGIGSLLSTAGGLAGQYGAMNNAYNQQIPGNPGYKYPVGYGTPPGIINYGAQGGYFS